MRGSIIQPFTLTADTSLKCHIPEKMGFIFVNPFPFNEQNLIILCLQLKFYLMWKPGKFNLDFSHQWPTLPTPENRRSDKVFIVLRVRPNVADVQILSTSVRI